MIRRRKHIAYGYSYKVKPYLRIGIGINLDILIIKKFVLNAFVPER